MRTAIALLMLSMVFSLSQSRSHREPASDESSPLRLHDFDDYELTNLPNLSTAQEIYDSLTTDLTGDFGLQCGSRAHVWAWQMRQKFGVRSGKLFLYYTPKSFNHTGMLWGFHVVSYVMVDGKPYVMEKIPEYVVDQGYYLKSNLLFPSPVPLDEWLEKLTGFRSCHELSLSEPSDRPWLAYFKTMKMIPDPDANCHLVRAPMDYVWPGSVHARAFSGMSPGSIDRAGAMEACLRSMKGTKRRQREAPCDSLL